MAIDLRFNLNATGIDQGNAFLMAKMSDWVYLSNSDNSINSDLMLKNLKELDEGFQNVYPFHVYGSQAAVVRHNWFQTIVFPGPAEAIYWAYNAMTFSGPYPEPPADKKYTFHLGFYFYVNNVWEGDTGILSKVKEIINTYPDNSSYKQVFITGHSLGGAAAVIAAAKLEDDGEATVNQMYTFGQPKVILENTTGQYDTDFRSKYFRIINNGDPVPWAPPYDSNWASYGHAGNGVLIGPSWFDATLKVIQNFDNGWYAPLLPDPYHQMSSYLKPIVNDGNVWNLSSYT